MVVRIATAGLFALQGAVTATKATATCYLPVDVYFLQDTTGSFIEDLPNVKAQIPSIITSINEHNPGSHFGVGEFRDKPYLNLGELSDYCTKLVHPLSSDIESVETAFSNLFASGGGDLPEAQLAAVIDSVNDQLIGWRDLGAAAGKHGSRDISKAGARLIIMSTDAKPHDPLDYDLWVPTSPSYMIPYPDSVLGISQNTLCRRYDYPSVQQMKAQLDSHNTYLAILTPDDDPEVTAKWRTINDDVLGNPPEFYQFIKNDSSDIAEAILTVLSEVTNYVCTLTTVAPKTQVANSTGKTTTTTTAPTTTTTKTASEATEKVKTTTTIAPTKTTTKHVNSTTTSKASTKSSGDEASTTTSKHTSTVTTKHVTSTKTVSHASPTEEDEAKEDIVTEDEEGCGVNECEGCNDCGSCNYGVMIRVKDKPKKLVLDYES